MLGWIERGTFVEIVEKRKTFSSFYKILEKWIFNF